MPEPRTLTQLGRYKILRELGRGAMGVVYEGFDPKIGRRAAIKTVQYERGQLDATRLRRFSHEAKAAGRLNHPNIVTIYEFDEDLDADMVYIAMEFIKGRELRDYFDEGRHFPLAEVERIMCEILDALHHAHSLGVTHRDLKPSNIFLTEGTASVKIADFGIARIDSSDLTLEGSIFGTPSFMSPEQFMGEQVTPRSDIFACGILLYKFLTGERPFIGSVAVLMHKILRELYLPPTSVNRELDPIWDVIIKRALARNPVDRFASAHEFAKAIRQAVSGDLSEDWTLPAETQRIEEQSEIEDEDVSPLDLELNQATTEVSLQLPPPPAKQSDTINRKKVLFWLVVLISLVWTGGSFLKYVSGSRVFNDGNSVMMEPLSKRLKLQLTVHDLTKSQLESENHAESLIRSYLEQNYLPKNSDLVIKSEITFTYFSPPDGSETRQIQIAYLTVTVLKNDVPILIDNYSSNSVFASRINAYLGASRFILTAIYKSMGEENVQTDR